MNKLFFSLLAAMLIFPVGPVRGDDTITSINVVAQEWTGQTNADGSGLYFELLNEIYAPLGIAVNAKIVPFDRAVMMLRNKSIDASIGFYSAETAKIAGWYFYMTPQHPIDSEKLVAIFKKGTLRQWHFPRSLTNRKVGWIQGYTFEKNIKTELEYQPLTNHSQAWRLLALRRIDFYLDNEMDAITSAQENGIELADYQFETIWLENIFVPFTKTVKSRRLMEIFDRRMVELRNNGVLKKLYQKWQRQLPPNRDKKTLSGGPA